MTAEEQSEGATRRTRREKREASLEVASSAAAEMFGAGLPGVVLGAGAGLVALIVAAQGMGRRR